METLKVDTRTTFGTRESHRLRAASKIPGVLYGHGEGTESISFDKHDLEVAIHHGERLLEIDNNGKKQNALVKDVQFDTFGIDILHVDLTRVDLDERVEVEVQVTLIGNPEGTRSGGVLHQTRSDVKIEVSVSSIPDELKIIVSDLQLHDHLTLGDIELPAGAKLLDDPEEQLCIVSEIAEEPEPELEEGEEPGAEEPEVITEKKDEDEDAQPEAGE